MFLLGISNLLYSLGQNCSDKIENKFFREKNLLPPKSMMFPKLWTFDNETLPDLTLL